VVFVKPDCDKVDFNIISHIPVLNGASQEDFLVIQALAGQHLVHRVQGVDRNVATSGYGHQKMWLAPLVPGNRSH